MYNYFMLTGVVTDNVKLLETAEGKKVVDLELSVTRDYKNFKGEPIIDKFKITCWESVAEIAASILCLGKKTSIKGRIAPKWVKLENSGYIPANDLIADRIMKFDDEDIEAIFESLQDKDMTPKEE